MIAPGEAARRPGSAAPGRAPAGRGGGGLCPRGGALRAAGCRQAEAACRAQGGLVLVELADPVRARPELVRARYRLNADLAPALAARVGLVLAWCDLACGREAHARGELRAARELYGSASGAGEEVVRAWWEARIAALDQRAPAAEAQLDAVRRRLLAGGSLGEAARSTLDLLAVRV